MPPENRRARPSEDGRALRARVSWGAGGSRQTSDWQEVRFTYASDSACDDEPHDRDVMHWVGQHQADRAQREAASLSRKGDYRAASALLHRTATNLRAFAAHDPDLQASVVEMDDLQSQVQSGPLSPAAEKELYFDKQRRMRGQKDHRGPKQ